MTGRKRKAETEAEKEAKKEAEETQSRGFLKFCATVSLTLYV